MTRPGFAVDIDNVLAAAEQEVQRIYVELTNEAWPRSLFASAGGLDGSHLERNLIEKIFEYFHETSIPHLPVMPGARLALDLLKRRYRIIIITARRPHSRPQTLAWLKRHRLPFDELYHTDEKADVAEDISLAVDDHPEHARAYARQGIPVFLMNQPWNQGIEDTLIRRVDGWDGLFHRFHAGAHERWPVRVPETRTARERLRQVRGPSLQSA